jgi:molybdenum cofactor sulfurtransferase
MKRKQLFFAQYPEYKNSMLDSLRKTQFRRWRRRVYADWVGGAQYADSLVKKHTKFLTENRLGNPHSDNESSAFSTKETDAARLRILKFLNADPNEYDVVFTKNATEGILITRHYNFQGGELLLTADNHNSVNGVREIAKRDGGLVRYSPLMDDLTLNLVDIENSLKHPHTTGNKLFIYPAKSNSSGNIHPLHLVQMAQDYGWDVMLDTAAFLANNRIDLSVVKPDFMPISFYKIFGYPTGIGCVIVKKSKYEKLPKRWFAGGSILIVSIMKDFFMHETKGYAKFEDGTINFAGIPAICNGLDFIDSLGDYKPRVVAITSWLHKELSSIKGIELYSPEGNDTIIFNIKKNSVLLNAWDFEKAARDFGIDVRTGCYCNPGVNEKLFGYDINMYEQFIYNSSNPADMTIERLMQYADGKPVGSIRMSFGYMNNFSDVERIALFVKKFVKNL